MNRGFLTHLSEAASNGVPFAVITIVETTGSSPRKVGSRMIVLKDGSIRETVGGGKIEHLLIQEALSVIDTGCPRLVRFDLLKDANMTCGGSMTAYVEPFESGDPVLIFGCGHVCRALAPLLDNLGFRVIVLDDRPEWADPRSFPDSVEVRCLPFEQQVPSVQAFLPGAYALVMTRGHQSDYETLNDLMDSRPDYLGAMASRNKAVSIRRRLIEAGHEPPDVERIRMPVGLPIGSTTPAEISVSIAADLIARRRQGDSKTPAQGRNK